MKVVGHRGAKGLAPENTIQAIQKALEHKADEVEIDVRVSSDGVPVLVHDHSLTDAAGNKLKVTKTTYAELKLHKSDLATLDEAIDAVPHGTKLIIEVKPGAATSPIIKIIKNHLQSDRRAADLLLASFSARTLKALHKGLPQVQIVVNERWSGVRASYRTRKFHTDRMSIDGRWLWRGYVTPLARRGVRVYAYTLNDIVKAKRLEKYGLAGVITDYPDRFES